MSRSNEGSTTKVRLFFVTESPKAYQFSNAPTVAKETKRDWIPKSVVDHITKFPKPDNHDYPEWEVTLATWLAEQKGLG